MRASLILLFGGAAVAAAAGTSAAPGGSRTERIGDAHFTAEVRGAIVRHHDGRVARGAAGRPRGPGVAFTISLGAEGGSGAIVLTRLGGGPPGPGRYPVGESAALDSAGGFRVLYLAGSATRPEGVFRAESGTVEIAAEGSGELRGHLDAVATGFVADDPDDETRRVTITADFRHPLVP